MGPPFLNGGNISGRDRDHARPRAFNGAAVSQRRKQALRPHKLRMKIPSMGPPFLNGGNRARAALHAPEASPSMGPPFLNGGNFDQLLTEVEQHLLQWGRRFSTAETGSVVGRGTGSTAPSMGPPFLNGGNTLGLSADSGAPNHLQWGRRFSTAETGRTASDRS